EGGRVGVVQGGGGARLAMKTSHELLVVREPLAQHLDRHEPAQRRVFGEKDFGHATAAQPPFDPVAAGDQPLVGGAAGRCCRRSISSCGGAGRCCRRTWTVGSAGGSFVSWIVRGQAED